MQKETNEEISKIDLSSVEEVSLVNGKKYIKYIDLKTNKPVMLDITNYHKSAKEIIESLQAGSFDFNSNNALYNTNGLLEMEQKYTKRELNIISIEYVEQYKNTISPDQLSIVNLFQKNKDRFNPKIKYVVPTEGLALDESNRVIVCSYNNDTNQYDVRYADTIKYEKDSQKSVDKMDRSIENINFDEIVEKMEIENKPIDVAGYMIDSEKMNQYFQYPELLERKNMTSIERLLWIRLLDSYKKRQEIKEKALNPPKVKQLKLLVPKTGFTLSNMNIFVSGITVGLFISFVIFIVIKVLF